MAKNYRKAHIAAKIEGTKGTPETLTATEAAILGFDPVIKPDIRIAERAPAGICSGVLPGMPGLYSASIRVRCELKGSGTIDALPLWASTLLIASSTVAAVTADTDVTLAPVTSVDSQKCATVAIWMDGRKHVAAGCMFNAKIVGKPGDPVYIEFEGRGIFITPTDAAAPTGITHESTPPLRLAGITFTLGGTSKTKISDLQFDMGNDIQLRLDAGVTPAIAHAYLADRRPALTLDPEAEAVADDDVWGDFLAGTTKAVVLNIGTTEGNRWALTAPAAQYDNPDMDNRQGLLVDRINANLCTVNGADDHFRLIHT